MIQDSEVKKRKQSWLRYQGDYAVSMEHGFDLYLRPNCNHSKRRFLYRVLQKKDLDVLSRINLDGLTCIDIGANIGYFTCFLYKQNVKTIYSFEPDPVSFSYLSKNTKDKANIVINNIAISSKNEELKLYLHPESSGKNRISMSPDWHSIEISALSLDHYLKESNNVEKVDFIKIDVEGHEMKVLQGAKNTIRKFRPFIYIEFSPGNVDENRQELAQQLMDFAENQDFPVYIIDSGKMVEIDMSSLMSYDGDVWINPILP